MPLFKKKTETASDIIKKHDCFALVEKVKEQYPEMTGIIIVMEVKKQTYWECAGMDPAQAILSLDQLHHRIQHEGLKGYD